jgi:hypothetical protein
VGRVCPPPPPPGGLEDACKHSFVEHGGLLLSFVLAIALRAQRDQRIGNRVFMYLYRTLSLLRPSRRCARNFQSATSHVTPFCFNDVRQSFHRPCAKSFKSNNGRTPRFRRCEWLVIIPRFFAFGVSWRSGHRHKSHCALQEASTPVATNT